jgi:uncharacterized damage-inducible protein DinB
MKTSNRTTMIDFFKDIFIYHYDSNQQLIDVFIQHQTTLSERTLPLFTHALEAHAIWNNRIQGNFPGSMGLSLTLAELKPYDHQNLQDTLRILDTLDLNKSIDYQNTKGRTFTNSVTEILFHVSNHFTHHRAQLISDLRLQGIDPPVTDYIFYKR